MESVTAIFAGVAPAVVAIVASALWRVARRALKNTVLVTVAAAAFIALFAFGVPFPVVVAAAGLMGYLGGRRWPAQFRADGHTDANPDTPSPVLADDALHRAPRTRRRSISILAVGLAAWSAPLIVLAIVAGDSVYLEEGLFFSGTAVVTFGGAYAVLSYIAQRAVEVYGWLAPGEMVRGLAMAESTPGPLIQVVQFVGFLGAYRNSGALDPWIAGLLASCLVTWVTYVPCFLWIFLGAPHIEALRDNRPVSDALTGITAAVVGVIGNLAVFFAVHALFTEVDDRRRFGLLRLTVPDWSTLSPRALAVALVAFALLFRLKWSVLRTLGACAALGVVAELVLG